MVSFPGGGHEICVGGGDLPHGIVSPWGNSSMGFLSGEGLPYGIP